MIIRPYEEKDKENVRFICLNSEGECKMTPDEQKFILTTYCDYYIENEGINCFVAVDDNDRAIAYIICTEDFDSYRKVFVEEYIPRLDEDMVVWGGNARNGASVSTKLQEKYKKDFPAHLHIDVLPEYHRQGIGHRLVDTLSAHLKEKGVRGVMLTVGAENIRGQSFYKKYGFEFIEKDGDDVAFGLRF
ncbi:MAG: GNAT family N-acetyltransferase [Oscillospiraceae bacterium]|nr:GNAT family N-acetyltransferase [Clostridia bacterium]MBQ3162907.1 GNAT family N-acetyltransferase [Oscillospiraceae bacterium]